MILDAGAYVNGFDPIDTLNLMYLFKIQALTPILALNRELQPKHPLQTQHWVY